MNSFRVLIKIGSPVISATLFYYLIVPIGEILDSTLQIQHMPYDFGGSILYLAPATSFVLVNITNLILLKMFKSVNLYSVGALWILCVIIVYRLMFR